MKSWKPVLLTAILLSSLLQSSEAQGALENLSTGAISTYPVWGTSSGAITTPTGLNFTVTSPSNLSCNYEALEDSIKAFDGSPYTKYCIQDYFGSPTIAQNEVVLHYLTGPVLVTQVGLTTANDATERDPVAWTLSGSNDGLNWTSIMSHDYGINTVMSLARYTDYPVVSFSNSKAYSYLKFDITNTLNPIAKLVQYSELRLYGTSGVPSCTFAGNSGAANNSTGTQKSNSPATTKSQGAGACQNAKNR